MRRRLLAVALVVIGLVGCEELTTQDKVALAADSIRIDMCVAKAHECKRTAGDAAARLCWPVYDECMAGAGLRDGGYHE